MNTFPPNYSVPVSLPAAEVKELLIYRHSQGPNVDKRTIISPFVVSIRSEFSMTILVDFWSHVYLSADVGDQFFAFHC